MLNEKTFLFIIWYFIFIFNYILTEKVTIFCSIAIYRSMLRRNLPDLPRIVSSES